MLHRFLFTFSFLLILTTACVPLPVPPATADTATAAPAALTFLISGDPTDSPSQASEQPSVSQRHSRHSQPADHGHLE